MSECSLLQTAKLTLCKIVLAACAVLPLSITGCGAIHSKSVPQDEAEQQTKSVVKQAIDYFVNKEYAKAQGLLEQRWDYLGKEYRTRLEKLQKAPDGTFLPVPELTPSEDVLLALSYAMNNHYDKAETRFTTLMTHFKNNPVLTIADIENNLHHFFKTEQYQRAENLARSSTLFYPKMNAVVGFLKLGKRDYQGALTYFGRAVPNFEESKVQEYRAAFEKLLIEGCKIQHPDVEEYAKILSELYRVKGKESNQN